MNYFLGLTSHGLNITQYSFHISDVLRKEDTICIISSDIGSQESKTKPNLQWGGLIFFTSVVVVTPDTDGWIFPVRPMEDTLKYFILEFCVASLNIFHKKLIF